MGVAQGFVWAVTCDCPPDMGACSTCYSVEPTSVLPCCEHVRDRLSFQGPLLTRRPLLPAASVSAAHTLSRLFPPAPCFCTHTHT